MFLRAAWLILRKDLTVEVRSREIAYTTIFFAVSCILVFAFALVKEGKPPEDGAATLTAFTAAAIARVVPLLPKEPKNWIVAGGGARNLTMLRMLRECLEPATVRAADTLGWASDAIEAQAFGFLAARGLKGLPLSYPATTGVPFPMTGGMIARP